MNERTLKKLEYDKIIALLSGYTSFSCGRELAEGLEPSNSLKEAESRLKDTDEGREVLRLYPTFSLGPVRDIREDIRHVAIGGVLEIEALVRVADTCRAARQVKTFFNEAKGSFPGVASLGKGLNIIKTIETAVEKAIGPDNSINDGASEALYQTRRKIKISNDRIKDRLESIIRNPNTAKFLQEAIITIRDNRYVVPVRQEYRGQIPGIVHDISASGASAFIEPMAVVELNNELLKLIRDEQEEINAILRALSIMVAGFSGELESNLVRLSNLDLIFAKAKLSIALDGTTPKLNSEGQLNLKKARHPLIPAELVVPIDVKLDKHTKAMIITGPNTGGKTVTLKTISLLTIMALAGLHIPVESGSELSFFSQIFADIGDEQSIEQSLSTFSSHMVNLVEILKYADYTSLVLLDELGAGTDPTEGAALAMAIISALQSRGVKIICTTHYSELKAFAWNTPGCVNASVEFDINSLAPTYRLLMGVPGKSNAFEISRRLGLPEDIILNASELITNEDAQVAELLANLEILRQQTAAEKAEVEALRQELEEKSRSMQGELDKAKKEVVDAERKANLQAQKIYEEAREKSEALYQEFKNRLEAEKNAEKAWQESRRKLQTWQQELEEQIPKEVFKGRAPETLAAGQDVFIPRINQYGTVLSPPDSENLVAVQAGILKIMLKLEDLRLAEGKGLQHKEQERKIGHLQIEKAAKVQNEIHLRGLEVIEALDVLDKYLDDAYVAGVKKVRIVHGKGTGALRNAVGDYLKKHRLVKAYRFGDYNEGGNGVTVAELDL